VRATNWRRAAVASRAAWLPWVLVGMSLAAALFGAWWISGTRAAVAFLAAWLPWLVIGAAGAVILSVFVWWLWWRLPKRQASRLDFADPNEKARADAEDNFRKTIGQVLGGAAVLIGAGIAYLQFQQEQTSAHDLLISNQVSKGFELLGNKEGTVEQRLGGIYALEGVMNTSEQYHRPVLEALCAFVRSSTAKKTVDDPTPADLQAALTVIGRRSEGAGAVDLGSAHISNVDLSGANLTGARLNHIDLTGAHLTDAYLSGTTLNGANLTDAHMERADLTAADLTDALLRGAHLTDGLLRGADLNHADLSGARDVTQEQLDQACGESVKGIDKLDPPLTFHPKPCPSK
jgi:uncharacterized protein YjbI with pentapeptide repeats